jgi:hypothetical protein
MVLTGVVLALPPQPATAINITTMRHSHLLLARFQLAGMASSSKPESASPSPVIHPLRFRSREEVAVAGIEVLMVTVEVANCDELVGKVNVEGESEQVISGDDVAQLSATVPPNCCRKLESDEPTDTVVVAERPH